MKLWQAPVSFVLRNSPLGVMPVRVRAGIAQGARWTLFPWTSYWRGTHEPTLQRVLVELGGGDIRGWNCWDIGAHFGLYSIGLARKVGPTGQVAAFEPNPISFRRLERHRAMNGLPWLKTYRAAVTSHNNGAELYTYGDLGTTTTHLPYDGETCTPAVEALSVPTVKLDDLVSTGELRRPHFVKIDAEGHAHYVLDGMREILRQTSPLFIVSFHCESELHGVRAHLPDSRYCARKIGDFTDSAEIHVGAEYLFTPRA